ncbi:MAG: DUF6531 domain-containing protein [Myxococcota bacterium]
MIGSSFMDPVLGVDVHFEMVPTPAPVPTPIPNPFIGVVFDPVGLAVGLAIGAAVSAVLGAPMLGPVMYWTAFPATNTGTEAKGVPGHIIIPPGVSWAPFPKTPKPVIHPGEVPKPGLPVKPEDDAVCIFGSKTVTVMGSNAVRLGDIALSCGEPVRLPSSVVLAVPKGPPILIGGPPSLDIMAALMGSLRTRFISDSLHAALSRLKPSRFRTLMNKAVCFLTGHPVDVASGKVLTDFTDFELVGPMPLTFERMYCSAFANRNGPLGHGWSHSLDQAVWLERGSVVLQAEDGREIVFDTFDFPEHEIGPGQSVFHPIERLTLHRERDGFRVVDANHVTRHFRLVPGGPVGRYCIVSIDAFDGAQPITFTYDAAGRLESVREAGGRAMGFVHDRQGRLTELHVPKANGHGNVCHRRFVYDDAGDLVRVVDAMGASWHFGYVSHLLTVETDRAGLSFYFQYDGLGEDAWCTRTWGDGGVFDHVLMYDKKKRATFVTDSTGQLTQYHMNVAGLVTKVVDPRGGETTYEYDPDTLQCIKETDATGNEVVTEYDARGALIRRVGPDGAEVTVRRDDAGRPVRATSAVGADWHWRYDRHGRISEEIDPTNGSRRFLYESGLLAGIIDPRGGNVAVRYNADRLPSSVVVDGEVTEAYAYDRQGNPLGVPDPRGGVRRMRRDAEGRVTEVAEPDGAQTKIGYDAEGRMVSCRDAYGETLYRYCGRGRLASRTRGGHTVQYEYDTEGRLVALIDATGGKYELKLDECGRVAEETDFMGRTHVYTRDAVGRVLSVVRPSGRSVEYQYDANGRVVAAVYDDGETETFTYRADGELASASNAAREVVFERDLLGRIVSETQDGCTVKSGYDAAGHRTALETSLGVASKLTYDAAGNLAAMNLGGGPDAPWNVLFEHDAGGNETRRTLPGLEVHTERDAAGRLVRRKSSTPVGLVSDMHHHWGPADRLRAIDDGSRGRTTFEHDAVGNLSASRLGEDPSRLRNPDAVGNVYRTPDRSDRDYGRQGQLLSHRGPDGLTRYRYDDDGQLTERIEPGGETWHYRWSSAGRLIGVTRPDQTEVELSYDALGRRVAKRAGEACQTYYWDGHAMVHEVDAAGAVVTWHYDAWSFSPLARVSGDEFAAVVDDHQGRPIALVDADGRTRWEGRVGPDGELSVSRGDVDCPFRHPGQYWDDDIGLSYNRFRYYDPEAGSFISPDPLRSIGGLNLGPYIRHADFGEHSIGDLSSNTSLYAYVGDPLMYSDPFGLVRIHTENGVAVNAYAGPPAGGIEHKPLHAHVVENGKREVRVLMEDWIDNGRVKGRKGQVYPGDPDLSKRARKVIAKNLDDLARKTREVFETGGCS